ncbi:hypothetical protein [Hyphococcus sp.]|uniref:hypothetical protein n=1 Tax=Hyphococcus sp. TaxID=2038636 RepID=UPI003CCBEEE6
MSFKSIVSSFAGFYREFLPAKTPGRLAAERVWPGAFFLVVALAAATPSNAQQILRTQTVSFDSYTALKAVPFARFQNGAAVIISGDGQAGLFIKDTGDWSTLVTADTAECVVIPSPQDTDGSSGGWIRADYLEGSDINPRWCGFGASGNTATEEANALNNAIIVASQMVLELIDKKAGTPTAHVKLSKGDYTLRPGIVFNRHGVILDLGGATLRAESGQTGALITNSYEQGTVCQSITSDEYCETNGAIVRNGYLVGDASANFAYDATAGSIGILTTRSVRDSGCENVVAYRFDTGYFYDGTFGFRHVNCSAISSGSTDADDMSAGLVIHNGTASYVQGGRYDYSNGDGNIIVDGDENGGTAALQFIGIVSQAANKSGMVIRDVDHVIVDGGDFEGNDRGDNDAPDILIDRTISGRNGQITIRGTNFIRTYAHDGAQAPVISADLVESLNVIGVFARDQVDADYTYLVDFVAGCGKYTITGYFRVNEGSSGVSDGHGSCDYGGTIDVSYYDGTQGYVVNHDTQDVNSDLVDPGFLRTANYGTLEIASGAITVTGSMHKIDPESEASTDDLDTINGGTEGDWLIIHSATSSRDPTVKHGTGNIRLPGGTDFTMNTSSDWCLFYRQNTNYIGSCFDVP